MNWISVKDVLPDQHVKVLVWLKESNDVWSYRLAERRYNSHWQIFGSHGNFDDCITHWTPLEPPKSV